MIEYVESKGVDWLHVTRSLARSQAVNRWTNFGPVAATLEHELRRWLRTDAAVVACASGAAALFALVEMHNHLAGRPLRWAVSSFGFTCSRQGPLRDAAVVDCDRRGLLDLDQLSADCEGVVFTNVFGTARDLRPYRERVRRMGKVFICDSAGAFDSLPHDAGEIVSLHHTKPWGLGEGGCAVVAPEHEALFRSLICFGHNAPERPLAFNGKMSDVAAAFVLQWLAGFAPRVEVQQEQFARLTREGMRRGYVPLSGEATFPVGTPQNCPLLAPVPVAAPAGVQKYYRPIAPTPNATDLFARILNFPCHGGVAALGALDGLFPTLGVEPGRGRRAGHARNTARDSGGVAMTRRLLICGTRSLAAEVADLASDVPGVEVVGFVENLERDRCREPFEALPVHWVDDLPKLAGEHVLVCALGTTHRSKFTDQVDALGLKFTTIVHPAARVSPRTTLGEGTIVNPGVIIASHTQLGRHVYVNRGVLIGHHTRIGDHVSLMPGANVAGNCVIGDATYVGMGAVVIDNLKIGAHSVIGAGAVVTKDVPDNVLVVGVPAKIVKENVAGK